MKFYENTIAKGYFNSTDLQIALSIIFFLSLPKKKQGKNLSCKVIGWCREYFFESLALADRDYNFLEHTVRDEFKS